MEKYIDNKVEKGLLYNWREIRKEYEKLGVPDGYYHIPWNVLDKDKYIINLSERSTGKTTNWLLVGLCMNKLYGTVIQYIRATADMLAPSHAEKLVEVVRSYNSGEYVKKLTDGEYNSIYYHWKQFFYCYYDEEKKEITRKSDEPIIQCLSIDKNQDYKSSYNSYKSRGDLIIFDEFIGNYYRPNECINFMDLTKTIIRDRWSPIIVMLANTINLNSFYFEELEISRVVKSLHKGDKKEIITERGTRIYIEILDVVRSTKDKSILNALFYGFKNPKLASITGGEVWAFESVPHIKSKAEGRFVALNNLYIEKGIELLKVEIVYNTEQGNHLEVHRATKTYDDSIILTLGELVDQRYVFGFGTGRLSKILSKYVTERKVYYSSNEVGSIFKDYIKQYMIEKHNY